MKTWLSLLGLFPAVAWAQPGPAPIIPYNLTIVGSINVTAATGYQINGANAVNVSSAARSQSFFAGPLAGASLPTGSQFLTAVGPNAGESEAAAASEFTLTGVAAGLSNPAGSGVAFGVAACSSMVNTACFAIGNDAMRDYYVTSDLGSMAIGNGALGDGTGGPDIAIGANTIWGAASTITVGNSTPHTGDVYTLSMATSNACNGTTKIANCTTNGNVPVGTWPVTASYTVQSSDTNPTILAASLAAAWTGAGQIGYILGDGKNTAAVTLLNTAWQIADATDFPQVIKGHYPGNWLLTPTVTCSGTCNTTTTVGAGYNGQHNIIVGNFNFASVVATTPSYNTIISDSGPSLFITTASNNDFTGHGIAPHLTSGSLNTVDGSNAFTSCITCSQNAVFGDYAGVGITGNGNAVFGDQALAGSQCITSGSNNGEFMAGACVPSSTSNYQLSIGNGIYGLNLSGTGSTVSPGQIGIMNAAPTAVLDVLGPDTSTTLAFRVQNSTPANVFSVTDAGVIAVGSGGFTANGTTSLALSNIGPTGAHATVQEWLTVTDHAGTVRYIPAF